MTVTLPAHAMFHVCSFSRETRHADVPGPGASAPAGVCKVKHRLQAQPLIVSLHIKPAQSSEEAPTTLKFETSRLQGTCAQTRGAQKHKADSGRCCFLAMSPKHMSRVTGRNNIGLYEASAFSGPPKKFTKGAAWIVADMTTTSSIAPRSLIILSLSIPVTQCIMLCYSMLKLYCNYHILHYDIYIYIYIYIYRIMQDTWQCGKLS